MLHQIEPQGPCQVPSDLSGIFWQGDLLPVVGKGKFKDTGQFYSGTRLRPIQKGDLPVVSFIPYVPLLAIR